MMTYLILIWNAFTINPGAKLAGASVLLSIAACVGYALAGDFRRATYWAAAAVLTTSVTV